MTPEQLALLLFHVERSGLSAANATRLYRELPEPLRRMWLDRASQLLRDPALPE